jgi:hypothetical protein
MRPNGSSSHLFRNVCASTDVIDLERARWSWIHASACSTIKVSPSGTRVLVHVLVADVDPTEECHLVVHEEDLAMVAAEVADEQPWQAVVDPDLAADLSQGGRDRVPVTRRAPTVDQDVYLHSSAGRAPQGVDETRAHAR